MQVTKQDIINALKSMRLSASDQTAAKAVELYPAWAEGIEITQDMIDKGQNRYQFGGKLYKCIQAHTTQAEWTPDITPALFTVIDVEHAGTVDDPIPWALNMECFSGKYYTWESVLYKCIRDSGIALAYSPDQLIGNYFEVA